MTFTLYGVPILLAAGATAQYGQVGYPTGLGYGQMAGFGYQGGFGGYMGGGYGGQYGRQCRSNVRSEDLQGGFQQCYCDKNHRDEDPTGTGKVEDMTEWRNFYKDIYDEDCVQRWQKPTNVRRCQAKTSSQELAGPAVCWCDSNHKKDADDISDEMEICDDGWGSSTDDDEFVAGHYNSSNFDNDCTNQNDLDDEWDAYDPNCVERFGGYGAYGGFGAYGGYGQQFGGYGGQFGGYGGFGMGYNAGYGQQFGGNMFYPTSFAQPAAAAPVDGAAPAPAATTWQFQPQQYMNGGYRGYQSGYYGR